MADTDVKWIKITTNIFNDDKILLIEALPSKDSILVIWFKLLVLAGRQLNDGVFILNNRVPYTDEMLASIFHRDLTTVRMALQVFEDFGMIEIVDGVITIPNWDKHQSMDAYEKKKERDRIYQQERRNKQKALIEKSSDNRLTSNDASLKIASTDIDKEKEKEIERDIDIKEKNNKKKKVATAPAVYVDNEELNEAIINFIQMRKQIKKPMTDRAVELMISKLNKLAGPDDDMAIKILEKSTMNCWTDIYPLDTKKSFSAKPNKVNWEDA